MPHAAHSATRSLAARYGDAATALLDQGFVSAVNFLTIVLLARLFSLREFGVFMLAHMALTLLTTVQNAAVAQPHNILGAQRSGTEYARLTAVLGLFQIAGSGLVTVALLTLGAILLSVNREYADLALALGAVALPWMGQEFVRRVLYTQNDTRGAALNDFVSYGLQLAGIGLLFMPGIRAHATPALALIMLGASSFVAMVLGVWQLRSVLAPRWLRTFPEMNSFRSFLHAAGDAWKLSKWLLAQQSVAWLGASGHGWILAALLGPANFGVYRATYQIVNILNPMRQAASNHLPSRAARTYTTGGVAALRTWQLRTLCKLMAPFILCAVAIVLAAEPLSRVLYGEKLHLENLQWLVALGALGYAINFARTPLDYAAMVAGGARQLFLRMVWLTAFVATVGVTLIATLGIPGAFMSEVAAGVLSLLLTVRLQSNLFGPSLRRTPAPEMGRIMEAPR